MGSSCTTISKPEDEIEPIINLVTMLTVLKATGTKEEMTKIANDYADQVGMDNANRNLFVTLKTEDENAFIKKAFDDPNKPGRVLSYAEMRGLYG